MSEQLRQNQPSELHLPDAGDIAISRQKGKRLPLIARVAAPPIVRLASIFGVLGGVGAGYAAFHPDTAYADGPIVVNPHPADSLPLTPPPSNPNIPHTNGGVPVAPSPSGGGGSFLQRCGISWGNPAELCVQKTLDNGTPLKGIEIEAAIEDRNGVASGQVFSAVTDELGFALIDLQGQAGLSTTVDFWAIEPRDASGQQIYTPAPGWPAIGRATAFGINNLQRGQLVDTVIPRPVATPVPTEAPTPAPTPVTPRVYQPKPTPPEVKPTPVVCLDKDSTKLPEAFQQQDYPKYLAGLIKRQEETKCEVIGLQKAIDNLTILEKQQLELLIGRDLTGDGVIGPVGADGKAAGPSIPDQFEKQRNDIKDMFNGFKNGMRDPWDKILDVAAVALAGGAFIAGLAALGRIRDHEHLPVAPILVEDGVVGGPEPTRRRRAVIGWVPVVWRAPIIGGLFRPEVPHVAYVPQEAVTRLRDAEPQVLSQGDVVTIGSGENLQHLTVNRVRILTRHGVGGEYRSYTLSNGREINEAELAGYAAQGALERITQAAPQAAQVGQIVGNSRVTAVDIDANSNRRYRVLENGLSNWRNEQYVTGLVNAANVQEPNAEHLAAPNETEIETIANLMVVLMGQALAQMSDEQLEGVARGIPAGAIQQVRSVLARLGVPAQRLGTPVQVIREFDRTIQNLPEDIRNQINARARAIVDERNNGEAARVQAEADQERERERERQAQRDIVTRTRIGTVTVKTGTMFIGDNNVPFRVEAISEDHEHFTLINGRTRRTVTYNREQMKALIEHDKGLNHAEHAGA